MKESYSEGRANYAGPESCGAHREVRAEALTGESAGWVLSREIHVSFRGADAVEAGGRQHRAGRPGQDCPDLARSETPRTRGRFSHGNREISPLAARVLAVRVGNPEGYVDDER